MNKSELLAVVAEDAGTTKAVAEKVLNAFAETVQTDVLFRGNNLAYPGLGTFKRVDTSARTGRNPATGQPVEIEAKSKVGFKPSPGMKS